ncbi:hypothetical protein BU24DRAFT_467632 [Aaosphaeria arxii CBS 175.79]|uniref:Uncharacterized protein n=1 Tax=Aaosphaeria arxii CBS 175.79 TaxID=1450172 RepID=A0A6A5XAQ9_9PLEO|nr:uncharacterized protein BU24DRAFT_467632 [Aaosphaeria arxii CBS 175.79]KAF2010155.1 hypothetical protein BU24DRAFT_467632 [Aaosphaeria arxii CBS 175.79]
MASHPPWLAALMQGTAHDDTVMTENEDGDHDDSITLTPYLSSASAPEAESDLTYSLLIDALFEAGTASLHAYRANPDRAQRFRNMMKYYTTVCRDNEAALKLGEGVDQSAEQLREWIDWEIEEVNQGRMTGGDMDQVEEELFKRKFVAPVKQNISKSYNEDMGLRDIRSLYALELIKLSDEATTALSKAKTAVQCHFAEATYRAGVKRLSRKYPGSPENGLTFTEDVNAELSKLEPTTEQTLTAESSSSVPTHDHYDSAVHNGPLEGHRSAAGIEASDYDVEHSGYTTETAASTDSLPGSASSSPRNVHHRKRVREEDQLDSSTQEVLRYYSSSPEDDFNEVPAIHRGASREEVFLQAVQYVRDEFPDVPIMDRLVEHVRDSLVRRVSENPQSERLHHSSNSQSPDTSESDDESVYPASDEEEHPFDSPASGDSFSASPLARFSRNAGAMLPAIFQEAGSDREPEHGGLQGQLLPGGSPTPGAHGHRGLGTQSSPMELSDSGEDSEEESEIEPLPELVPDVEGETDPESPQEPLTDGEY